MKKVVHLTLLMLLLFVGKSFAGAAIVPAFGTFSSATGGKISASQQGSNTLNIQGVGGAVITVSKVSGRPTLIISTDGSTGSSSSTSNNSTFDITGGVMFNPVDVYLGLAPLPVSFYKGQYFWTRNNVGGSIYLIRCDADTTYTTFLLSDTQHWLNMDLGGASVQGFHLVGTGKVGPTGSLSFNNISTALRSSYNSQPEVFVLNDGDKFSIWGYISNAFQKITWANIVFKLQSLFHGLTITFSEITGEPSSNVKLNNALNGKAPYRPATFAHLSSAANGAVSASHMPVNVVDAPYNADPTGVVDATDAILAAISAKGGRIYLPKGVYKINSGSSQLVIKRDSVILEGDGPQNTILKNYGTGDAVRFESDNPSLSASIRWNCGIRELMITRVSAITTGDAVHLLRTGNFQLSNVMMSEHYESLLVEGSINSDYYHPLFYAGIVQTSRMAGSAHIRIKGYPISDGDGYYEGFTHKFFNVSIAGSANKVTDYGIDIGAVDTAHFEGGYIGMTGLALMRLKSQNGASIYNVKVSDMFFDGVYELTGTDKGLLIEDDGNGSNSIVNTDFTNVRFGQVNYGVDITDQNARIQITGCNFHNIATRGFYSTASNAVATIGNGYFDNIGFNDATGGAIYFSGGNTINLSGNTFYNIGSATAIKFAGTIGQGNISGSVYTLCNNKVVNNATFTNGLTQTNGDVVGPASATQFAIPTFADTTGKTLINNIPLTYASASLKHEITGGTASIQNTAISTGTDVYSQFIDTAYLGSGSASNSFPLFLGRTYGGTPSALEATPSGKTLFEIQGRGWDGTTGATGVSLSARTDGLWSGTNHGAYWLFSATPLNSVALGTDLRIDSTGVSVTGNVAVTGTVDGVDLSAHDANVTTKHLPAQSANTNGYSLTSNGSSATWSDTSQTPGTYSILKNGGFEVDNLGWSLGVYGGANATLSTDATNYKTGLKSGKITVTTGTSTVSNIQLTGGINDTTGVLIPGETYIYQMWIKSSASTTGKTLAVAKSVSPYDTYLSKTISTTTSWQLISGRFTYTGLISDNNRVLLQLGGSDSDGVTYNIDGVSILPANGYRGAYSRNGIDVAFEGSVTATALSAGSGHLTAENVTSTGATGTGKLVFDNSPSFVTPSLGAATATSINSTSIPASATLTTTVASGTASLGTSAITSGNCATAVSVTATGVTTSDVVDWGFNGDPTGITGYIPSTNGMLTIIAYPTANFANFKVCNNTGSSVIPGAITLNFKVRR